MVPVYISHDGTWYTGSKLTDIKCYTPFDPYDKDLTRVSLDMTVNSGALLHRERKGIFGRETESVAARIEQGGYEALLPGLRLPGASGHGGLPVRI